MIRIPFFGDSENDSSEDQPQRQASEQKAAKPAPPHPLDAATGGIFSAATSSERAARVRSWLDTEPDAAAIQEVYKELSLRDKGAARPLREKLDAFKRSKEQETLATEWATRANALLQTGKLNIADAMAWQRDAAKAGAPLSRDPLLTLKNRLTERIGHIEDLQTRSQVQREAAALLAQRIELLSTKSWREADAVRTTLQNDVQHWHAQTLQLQQDAHWEHVDARHAGQLESATQQLDLVARAFVDALEQARAAAADSAKPLPPVQVWADELRSARSDAVTAHDASPVAETAASAAQSARQNEAEEAVQPLLQTLEKELAGGHSKTTITAAQALRQAMKEHGRFLQATLETRAQTALAKATELESWQRWRADQLRTELAQKAEALIHRPAVDAAHISESEQATPRVPAADETATSAPAQTPTPPASAAAANPATAAKTELPTSPHSPRKLQDMLRQLREQWKEVDQGGVPNHALWRRFDQACNEAYRIVQAWLAHMKQHAAEQKALRLNLLNEVKTWGETLAARATQTAESVDWKAVHRELGEFSRRWREAGHVSEKVFADLQPQWKAAIRQAAQPLEAMQQASLALRQQLIEQARALGNETLRIDAIKDLQQRWQQETQRVPLERRQEQKLWDAFRKPIDEAFKRRSQQREHAASVLNQRDQAVLQAVQALDAATASGDAQQIRSAMQSLETAMRAQQAGTVMPDATPPAPPALAADDTATHQAAAPAADTDTSNAGDAQFADAASAKPAAPRQVVARRGDDRPGARIAAASAKTQADGRLDRKHASARANANDARRPGKRPARHDAATAPAPRLGDAAFRAQREAVDRAQTTLRKLAAQAHGETLVQILAAWEQRSADVLPPAQTLNKARGSAQRNSWAQALRATPAAEQPSASEALLRLEMAADTPTPAEHLEARRALQLQLLTRRNDPAPAQTWVEDVARVLAGPYDAAHAKRLQNTLRVLLKQ